MQIRKAPLLCGLIMTFLTINIFSQQTTRLSLQQAIETAVNNNLLAKQRNLQMQTAAVTWKQSRANLLPDLIGQVSHGVNQGHSIDPFTNGYVNENISFASYGLSSSVTLFNGFLLQNTIKQNAYAYDASKMEWQQTKDNITLNVILAYLQILNNEDLLEQARQRAELTSKQLERSDVLNQAGNIPPGQYYDLKGQLAGDQLAMVDNQNALDAAKLNLSQLMTIPFDKNMEVERLNVEQMTTMYDATPDKIYEIALEQLSIIKGTQLRRQSAKKGVQAARGNFFPQFFLAGNLGTNYSSAATSQVFKNTTNDTTNSYVTVGLNDYPLIVRQNNYLFPKISYSSQFKNNYSTQLSVGIRIPIVNSLRARNNLTLAKIDLKNAEYIEESTKIQLRQSIEEAYFNMTAAFKRYQAVEDEVQAYAESFRTATVRFDAGAITSVEYLTTKNNLDRASISLISARYDYILRTKILDYYQAKPLW